MKKMNSLGDLWDNIKSYNTCVVGIPKIEEKNIPKTSGPELPKFGEIHEPTGPNSKENL